MSSYTSWQKEEIRKCQASFHYFAENYLKVIHPVDGIVSFKLYEYQSRVVSDFEKNKYNIVSKFRQAGLTTLAVLWSFWRCMFKMNQRIMVLSKSDREAIGVGKIVLTAQEELPEWLRPIMRSSNSHEKEFIETKSCMWFHTSNAARSKSLTYLIIDEAAFIQNMEEQWKAMYPTLSTGGNCIVISTVNGLGNWYEETYTKATENKNQFHVIDLDYREHPEYCREEWQRQTRANIGEKGWLQEYERKFLGSSETYIPMSVITDHEKKCLPPYTKLFPEWDSSRIEEMSDHELANFEYEKGALWIWKDPQPGREYMISVDASDGANIDYSAMVVLDQHSFEQVGEFYSNKIPPYKFAQVIVQIGMMFNEALVVVENIGAGSVVLSRMENTFRYPHLYYEDKKSSRNRPGILTTAQSRPLMMETLQTCLYNKIVKIRSSRMIKELKTFIYNGKKRKPEALKNKHDDLIMALSIALYVSDTRERDMPIGAKEISSDNRITKALMGQSYEDIRKILEDGMVLEEDLSDMMGDEVVEDVLLPVTTGSRMKKNLFYREFAL